MCAHELSGNLERPATEHCEGHDELCQKNLKYLIQVKDGVRLKKGLFESPSRV